MAKLGQIKIISERKVNMVELDLDMDDQTIEKMAYAGFNMIKYDKHELASYAFRKGLEAFVSKNKKCSMQLKVETKKRRTRNDSR